jgi:hypothetical protein
MNRGTDMTAKELLDREMASLNQAVLAWSVSARKDSDFEPKAFAAGFAAGVFECFKYIGHHANPDDGSAFSYTLDQFLYVAAIKSQLEKHGVFRE